ncbi:hypothetical protein FVE85_2054 [Porphyridium purpureum]|uniref:Uncharacterized protein n=1 Tax=Porphyridium purpureum TaxID=35688 RepID=A0A5J4YWF4_PORPP|nr:hypothetical protein FVE85_2054 [Porphyridium purpureum]|eukprot:POR4521..scf209_3
MESSSASKSSGFEDEKKKSALPFELVSPKMMKRVVPVKKGSGVTSPEMTEGKSLERKISDLSDNEGNSQALLGRRGTGRGRKGTKDGEKDERDEKEEGAAVHNARVSGRNFIKTLQKKVKVPKEEDDGSDDEGEEDDKKKQKSTIQRPPEPDVLLQPEYRMRYFDYPDECSSVLGTFLMMHNGVNFHLKEILCAAHQLYEYGEKGTDKQFTLYYKWWADVCSLISCMVDMEDEIIAPFLSENITREFFNPKAIPESVTLLLQQNTISQFKIQIGKHRNKKLADNTYLYTLDYFKQVQEHSEKIVHAYRPLLQSVLSEPLQDELNLEMMGRLRDRKHFESLVWLMKSLPDKEMRKEYVNAYLSKPEMLKVRVISQVYNRKQQIAQEAIYMAKEVDEEHYEEASMHLDDNHLRDGPTEKAEKTDKAEKKKANGKV